MSKPLTKQAFLEGKPFYCPDNLSLGIHKHYRAVDGENIDCKNIGIGEGFLYEGNIRSIFDDSAIVYTTLLGRVVDTKIYYHEYNLVEEDLKDGTNN